jgi:small subunit ribosomal protein S6
LNDYELVTILNGEIKDEDVEETVGRIGQFISNRGGEVQNIDQWGRRRLAYPIGRQLEGTYVVTHLRMPPANAAELEANLRISEDVIRHLLVRYSPAEQAAAIAAAQRRRPRPTAEGEPSEEAAETAASTEVSSSDAAVEMAVAEAAAADISEPNPESTGAETAAEETSDTPESEETEAQATTESENA